MKLRLKLLFLFFASLLLFDFALAANTDFIADGNITVSSVIFETGTSTADMLIMASSTAESWSYSAGLFTATDPGSFSIGSADSDVKSMVVKLGSTAVLCQENTTPGTSYVTIVGATTSPYKIYPSSITDCQTLCSVLTGAATYNDFPTCGAATCSSGYTKSGTGATAVCNQNSSSSGGGGTVTSDVTPPAKPGNFKAEALENIISLSWTNPVDSDFNGVLILRTEAVSSPVCAANQVDSKAKRVYLGTGKQQNDMSLNSNLNYCYSIFSYDKSNNYSAPLSVQARPKSVSTTTQNNTINTDQTGKTTTGKIENAEKKYVGAAFDQQSLIESNELAKQNSFVKLTDANVAVYKKIMAQVAGQYEQIVRQAVAKFIQDGTPTTIVIGAGERAGVVGSYNSAFKRLPKNDGDWLDVIKIANGRWTKEKNSSAEVSAEKAFKAIYLRAPNRKNNRYDDNAVNVIAYGLRPSNRNVASEAAAVKSFKYVYKKLPVSANDWDIVRAIAYSGAKR
jgi:hypothetical protein